MTNELLLFIAEQMGLHNTHIVTHMGVFGEVVYEDKLGNEIPFNPSPDTVKGKAQLYDIETWLEKEYGVASICNVGQWAFEYTGSRGTPLITMYKATRHEAIYAACQWVYDNQEEE